MAQRSDSQDDMSDDLFKSVVQITERGRTIRTGVISVAVVVGLLIVAWATVTIVQISLTPPWVAVVIAIVGALGVPSAAFWIAIVTRDRYIIKHHRRLADLERQIDRDRSSSEPNGNDQ